MTCEVLVMNRNAAVLAADSAVTVRSSESGDDSRPRYSKGGNKIYQLSNHEPVAVMIFQGASLQGMPWEIIIKRFRTNLARQTETSLVGYANRFFDFIRNDTQLFPQTFRKEVFDNLLQRTLLDTINELRSRSNVIFETGTPDADRAATWQTYLAEKQTSLGLAALPPGFVDQDVVDARASVLPDLIAMANAILPMLHAQAAIPSQDFAELLLIRSFKDYESLNRGDYTGIVFSGYGENDFFPGYREYSCFGFIASKLVVFERGNREVTLSNPSWIEGFARTSMVDQFIRGMNFQLWMGTQLHFRTQAKRLTDDVFTQLGVPPVDVSALVDARTESFRKEWQSEVYKDHWKPLSSIISTLAIEEMTELAETLVMLESLKERVTSPDQSVGGPIDVAVITKAEGFVWVKRKLFFDGKLNDRYFLRLREKFTPQAEAE